MKREIRLVVDYEDVEILQSALDQRKRKAATYCRNDDFTRAANLKRQIHQQFEEKFINYDEPSAFDNHNPFKS